ncbi:MAG: glycosyltransferase [Candidatus Roizmanbacteria bacterium]|nr:glycosyltransferase [Candidatus Roizmanbacteria bacterium]
MKIAIFHNFLDNIGGAEKTDLLIARELGADIYTTNIDVEKIRSMGFSTDNIFSIGRVPINAPFRQDATSWRFSHLNLKKKYDAYIIAGDWALSGAIHNHPNLWYVYSPSRELWDLYPYTRKNLVPWHGRFLFDVWVHYHRHKSHKILPYVDKIIATSNTVKERIKHYLDQESIVLYPPIDTSLYSNGEDHGYWLSVNRLITHKRVDMQIQAFAQLPKEKLVIVGSYEKSKHFDRYAHYIQSITPPNVEIRSWVSDEELRSLYAHCHAFITTSLNEDFGLTPLEAMASGKPVIAPNEGGYRETLVDGHTGLLITNIDTNKIITAVKSLAQDKKHYEDFCKKHAQQFDIALYIDAFKKELLK